MADLPIATIPKNSRGKICVTLIESGGIGIFNARVPSKRRPGACGLERQVWRSDSRLRPRRDRRAR